MREVEAVNEELNAMIEAACPTCGGGDFIQIRVDAFELKNLLNLMVAREDELLKRIKALEAQYVIIGPIK